MKREMTPKERIIAAITHQKVDHIPTDYWGVYEIGEKLNAHFGVSDIIGLAKALDMDKIINVGPIMTANRFNMWNIPVKVVSLPNGQGCYEEPTSYPIGKYETIEEIEGSYEFPNIDMFDYSTIAAQCAIANDYAIEGGYTSLTYFYQIIRGTEQMLIDLIENPKLAKYILHRLQEFSYAHMEKILDYGDGKITVTQITDDFGTQQGLVISPVMIEEYLGDYYKKNIKLAKSYNAHVFHHDDGAIASLIPWLLDKGIEILNPLQWHLPGWDLKKIKSDNKDKLCYHGGIDNQHVLPFGTEAEVRNEVRECIDSLFTDKTGYILAPCHNFQANTPLENILAMYDEAKKYGTVN